MLEHILEYIGIYWNTRCLWIGEKAALYVVKATCRAEALPTRRRAWRARVSATFILFTSNTTPSVYLNGPYVYRKERLPREGFRIHTPSV